MSKPVLLRLRAAALMLSLASPVAAQDEQPNLFLDPGVDAHAGIDDLYRRFSEAYRTLDAEIIGTIYSKEALYLSPDSEIRRGGDTIAQGFAGGFRSAADRGERREIAFRIVERGISGSLAYDVGMFTLTVHGKDGALTSHRGKFVVVVRKEDDGTWRFRVDGYSDIVSEP